MSFLKKTKHTQILELKNDFMYDSRTSCSTKRLMSCFKNSADNVMVVARGEGGGGRMKMVKAVKCMVVMTFSGEHIMQYIDDVSQKCTLETHVQLLTNVTPVKLIRKLVFMHM